MFFKNYQVVFIFFLIAGTVIAVSSNSWVTSWLGLEINLMSLIPLILSELNFKSTEASIKYFLAQAMASILLVSSAAYQSLQGTIYLFEKLNMLIFLSLAIKTGMAPFHAWFPQVMEWISWTKCLIILTWQKIAPFILMSCFSSKMVIFFLIFFSSAIGAAGGLNQTNNKLILTYSSIAHSSWMIMLTSSSIKLWGVYFLVYSSTVAPIVALMAHFNLKSITEIYTAKMSMPLKLGLSSMVMSLGGLPPFFGFTAKLVAILSMIKMFPMAVFIVLISSSLVSLFFYLKMFFNILVSFNAIHKNFYSTKNFNNLMFMAVTGNLIVSSLVLLT